ncbi:glycosyltransferase [Heyndrickxia coagulans]|uniref:glycosyltransferase n=1 Tax=Heyndrickxia coagulans TaxID=1398 RepID=UPI00036C489F|nr:glycosyltransferase [Heyndrickxia coagulans]
MRIIHVGEYVSGGVATYIKEVANYQKKDNEVLLLLSKNGSEDINISNVIIKKYKDYNRGNLMRTIGFLFFIKREIDLFNPDIVHIHSSFAGLLTRTIYFFKKKRFKIVYCSHGWSFSQKISNSKKRLYAFIEKLLSIKTDAIINVSYQEHANALKYKLPASKMQIILSGVRPPIYTVPIEKSDKHIINLAYFGRFDYAKGIDILVNIFKKNHFNNLSLNIFGDSILNEFGKELFNNLPDNVSVFGWIDNEKIDDYIARFDGVIIPSRWEGFGLVAIEAMRNSKPVICSNIKPLSDIIKHNYNGLLYDNEEDLITILKKIDKLMLKDMGINGYELYKKLYTSDIMNKKILSVYFDLLSEKNSSIMRDNNEK